LTLPVNTIAAVITSLRNFARLDEADLQESDLHEGIDSTLTLLHHELKTSIRTIRDFGDIPLIYCYPRSSTRSS
jgi:phosphoglycerate-specific signal transduction histidine kinase